MMRPARTAAFLERRRRCVLAFDGMFRRFAATMGSSALLWASVPAASAHGSSQDPGASSAADKHHSAAVLPVTVNGDVADADRAALTQRLLEGLERGQFAVVSPATVVTKVADAGDCKRARCMTKIAESTGASHIVRAVVTASDRDYKVRVELIDGRTGAIIASSEDGCEICGVADVGTLLAAESATLRSKLDALASGPAMLVLHSTPAGAVITIDGEIAGTSPLELAIIPGEHVVRVQREGFIAVEREVTFVDGVVEQLDFKLERLPSHLPGRTWGYVSLGVGVAALGLGVTFTAMHSDQFRPDCAESTGTQDIAGECRYLWNTKWGGMAGAAVGTALITFGVAVLLNRPRSAYKPKGDDTAKLLIGPGSLGVSGRF